MLIVAFACFLVLVAAWLVATNVEGSPEKPVDVAPLLVDAKAATR
ncbi:MAG: hypothetical protein U0232_28560 [Thermomicrobiales bacterium]